MHDYDRVCSDSFRDQVLVNMSYGATLFII